MPAGPAALALATGAALLPVTLTFPAPRQWGLTVHPEVPVPAEGRRPKVSAMTQQLADAFAGGIAAAPQDWHMLQRLWVADFAARSGGGCRVRIGIVCPYTWDVPGGVQAHIRDLAEELIREGHEVSVLASADDDEPLPSYVVPAGRAVPVRYNGSVARLTFGPISNARVRRWLRDGEFDVLHVHEPAAPSLSLLACYAADGPIVATFHAANPRSRVLRVMSPTLQPALEKIRARIAVSEAARRTLVEHFGGDAVVIPNGVDVAAFRGATPLPDTSPTARRWASSAASTSRARGSPCCWRRSPPSRRRPGPTFGCWSRGPATPTTCSTTCRPSSRRECTSWAWSATPTRCGSSTRSTSTWRPTSARRASG